MEDPIGDKINEAAKRGENNAILGKSHLTKEENGHVQIFKPRHVDRSHTGNSWDRS